MDDDCDDHPVGNPLGSINGALRISFLYVMLSGHNNS